MRKWISRAPLGASALTVCVLLAACGSSGSKSSGSVGSATTSATAAAASSAASSSGGDVSLTAAKGATVQVIDAAPTPAVAGLDEGYGIEAKKLGINIQTAQSDGDPSKDITNIEDAESKGAKGLLLIPVSVAADKAALRSAVEKKMCVGVAYSNITPGDPITPGIKTYFGYNDATGGRALTAAMARKMGGKGGIVYIGGTASDPGSQTREAAIKAELKAKYPNISFLAAQPGNYDPATARSVMQNMLSTYGDKITGVVTAADSMSEAVADYIATTSSKGKILVGGFGGQKSFIQEIKAGKAYATVPFPVVSDGERAMQRIAQCIAGDRQTVYDSSTTQSVMQGLKSSGYVLTAGNLAKYTPQY